MYLKKMSSRNVPTSMWQMPLLIQRVTVPRYAISYSRLNYDKACYITTIRFRTVGRWYFNIYIYIVERYLHTCIYLYDTWNSDVLLLARVYVREYVFRILHTAFICDAITCNVGGPDLLTSCECPLSNPSELQSTRIMRATQIGKY